MKKINIIILDNKKKVLVDKYIDLKAYRKLIKIITFYEPENQE